MVAMAIGLPTMVMVIVPTVGEICSKAKVRTMIADDDGRYIHIYADDTA
jgi:hypothetical protein